MKRLLVLLIIIGLVPVPCPDLRLLTTPANGAALIVAEALPPPVVWQRFASARSRITVPVAVLGSTTGLLSSLLGVGGGPLLTPLCHTWIGLTPRQATATSNAIMVPIGLLSMFLFYRVFPALIDLQSTALMLAGASIGIYVLAPWFRLTGHVMQRVWLVLVATVSLKYLPIEILMGSVSWNASPLQAWLHEPLWGYGMAGVVAGWLAANLGVGGGVIVVPLLNIGMGLPMSQASAKTIQVVPWINAKSAFANRHDIRWPIVFSALPFGWLGAIIGDRIRDGLPTELIKNVYGFFLVATCIFLWKHLQTRDLTRRSV